MPAAGVAAVLDDGDAVAVPDAVGDGEALGDAVLLALAAALAEALCVAEAPAERETEGSEENEGEGEGEGEADEALSITAVHTPPPQANACVNAFVNCKLAITAEDAPITCRVCVAARSWHF